VRCVAAALIIMAVTFLLQATSIGTAGVAAPLLLLSVVVAARLWGTVPALCSAAVGAAAYSYYFLPPAGFAIEDPEDWIAFITFTVTAVIAGELASRAERRAAEAQAGRREIERLYQELQAAFERASEAEAARRNEQLKAALLDALRHNLRTPLTAIKAAVTALIRPEAWASGSALSRDERRELLQVIDEESDRLNRFIEGLSAPDRAEPAQPLHLRSTAVREIIKAGLVRAETLTRDHRVHVAIADDLPGLAVDPASMTEVIYIVLDNASKYAPPGSAVTIAATLEDEKRVRIAITDEGPGIPADLRERVFEKFFRVPARESHDPRRGGIGLGLPIARRLVDAQAGRMWIEDGPGARGTSVIVVLPVNVEASTPKPAPVLAGSVTS
jgi:K+-sensing histidine kinase KdpD